jgi:hypothetical protein
MDVLAVPAITRVVYETNSWADSTREVENPEKSL